MVRKKAAAHFWVALLGASLCGFSVQNPQADIRSEFHVKYVAAGAVYLDGGRNAGLAEGMTLDIKRRETTVDPATKKNIVRLKVIARVRVVSVAEVSAVCEVPAATPQIKVGDKAYLEGEDVEKEVEQRALSSTRKYPQVISFTEGDPLEDEVRAAVPRPPLPEVNRARGRIGFEYGGLRSAGPFAASTTQLGLVLRMNVTRINGTYWNLDGYWRGRLDSRSGGSQLQTIQDLINRTYHMQMTYSNPHSRWVAGFGRLYLPWASSLDTLDGGYVGRRFGQSTTAGIFAGSTPDPTSWDYSPNRRLAGGFINFEGGSNDSVRYTSTWGVGVSTLGWTASRPFLFTENGISYKQSFSIYQSMQVDRPHVPGASTATNSAGISRSFVTVEVRPAKYLAIDLNHNYFREIPTFDLGLISTGLLDQMLFQGFSAGVRVELPDHVTVYNSLGRSMKSGDARSSWNQMYGVTWGRIWRTGLRGDARYSKFTSSFGSGNYYALSLSRQFSDALRGEVNFGRQSLLSPFTRDSSYRTLGGQFDWFPKGSFYLDGGFTRQLGNIQSYSQWYVGLGYRFDTVRRHAVKEAK